MSTDAWLAGYLPIGDAAALADVDPLLVSDVDEPTPAGWLEGVIEVVAGVRTHDGRVRALQNEGKSRRALRLAVSASDRGTALAVATGEVIRDSLRALVQVSAAQRTEIAQLLERVPPEASDSAALAIDFRAELAQLDCAVDWPLTGAQLTRWLAVLDQTARLLEDAKTLVAQSETEVMERENHLKITATAVAQRLVGELLSRDETTRTRAVAATKVLPDLVLDRRFDVLERWRDGEIEMTALPALPRRMPSRPPTLPPVAPTIATRRLCPFSRSLLEAATGAVVEVTTAAQYREVREKAARLSRPDERRTLLGHAKATQKSPERDALLGAGLVAAGLEELHDHGNTRIARHVLVDALACLVSARSIAEDSTVRDAVTALAQCRFWAALAKRTRRETEGLCVWPADLGSLLRWAREAGELSALGEVWADREVGVDVARELLATLRIYVDDAAALLRACAGALLRQSPIAADPELAFAKLRDLLIEAGPSKELLATLEKTGQDLVDVVRSQATPAARNSVQRDAAAIERELSRLTTGGDVPLDVVREHLADVLKALTGTKEEAREQKLTLKVRAKALFLGDRRDRLRIPVLVTNPHDSLPCDDVFVSLRFAGTEGSPALGMLSKDEVSLGSIDPGDHREASFYVNATSRADSVGSVRVVVEAKSGFKVIGKRTEAEVILTPASRAQRCSPFQPGVALEEDEGFVGRETHLKSLSDALLSNVRRVPAVVGIRRVGKTSILHALGRSVAIRERYVPLYVSLEDRPLAETTVTFLIYVTERILEALHAVLDNRAINALPFSRERYRTDPFGAFEAFWTAIEAREPRRGVLLILDEFDKLTWIAREGRERQRRSSAPLRHDEVLQAEVFGALRKMVMGGRVIRLVVAGLPRLLRQEYEDRFFGILEPVRVGGFTDDEARRVMGAASNTMTVTEEGQTEIQRATGGQPYLLQIVCHALFSKLIVEGRDVATEADVADVIEGDVYPNQAYFTDFLDLLNESQWSVVRAIARLHREAPWRHWVSISSIRRHLESEGRTTDDLVNQLEELCTDDRPLVDRAGNNLYVRLRVGLIGDQVLR